MPLDISTMVLLVVVAGLLIWGHRSVALFLKLFLPNFLKRLPMALFTMWVVATTVFFLAKAAGGEEDALLKEGRMDARTYANLREQFGLDEPLYKQYFMQMSKLVVLDTIPSRHQNQRTFREIAAEHAPNTARLAWRALMIAVLLGIPMGVFTAVYHHRWPDQLGRLLALLGMSVPNFILASLAIYFFSRKMQWIQPSHWQSDKNLWLAGVCLSAFSFAAILRLTRVSMLEALREDFVRTARAKGVSEWKVVFRHALRNSLSSVVTYVMPVAAGMLVGSLVVETIFNIPGLGDMFVVSVQNRDMPLILGITVFYCGILVSANLIADSLYPVLNPRLRKG
ncbi:MAG: oligopeptide transport system permease protein [Candidatus Sumerlaeota bacterium]|nr:oligopeptide transport system permease protein [Candidatus Sumerlaeota bacterium]